MSRKLQCYRHSNDHSIAWSIALRCLAWTVVALFFALPTVTIADDPRVDRLATFAGPPATVTIRPGDNVAFELQSALINCVPGEVIELSEGRFEFDCELNVTCDNVTIRGAGHERTVLSFANQSAGSEGILATGNSFVIENLAVEDTVGNAIKVLGSDGVTFRGVRTEWTGPQTSSNGAYGIYPVECRNVLIDGCVSIGASDAGIYVGQSHDVIVRNCTALRNVAGIEIENTIRADVYNNVAVDNVGGILVFDLPGLNVVNGGQVRVHHNLVQNNNHECFAAEGTIVSGVPVGTGVMVMATDHVEVFDNKIHDHQTCNVCVVSFLITERKMKGDGFDPYPESISIHDNDISRGGYQPNGGLGEQLKPFIGRTFPDIFYDGFMDEKKFVDGKLPSELGLHVEGNGEATFGNVHIPNLVPSKIFTGRYRVDRRLWPLEKIELAAISPVKLKPHARPIPNGNPAVAAYRKAPRWLSKWKLFVPEEQHWVPADDVLVYRLNTPLFSDYSVKHRMIRLPDGEPMQWTDDSPLEFPVGSVIAKTFSYPDPTDDRTAGQRFIETRIELREPSGWYGYSYIWNEEQTDAELNLGGGLVDVEWSDEDGTKFTNAYRVPNANQCLSCHSQNGKYEPIGPTGKNLNGCGPDCNDDSSGTVANQLAAWLEAGHLAGAPEVANRPKLASFDDQATGSLDARARAWLDVNCAHCHNPGGTARTSGLDLRECQDDLAKIGVWKSPVATGKGSGGRSYDIIPGKPDKSILMYRLETDKPGARMPNLARNLVHHESNELIRAWIDAMPVEKKNK